MSSCSSEEAPRPFSAPTSFGPTGLFHSEVESDGEQTVMNIYQHRLEGASNPRGRKPKGAYLFGIDQRLPGMSVLKGVVKVCWPKVLPAAPSPPLSAVASRFGEGVRDAVASHRAQRLGNRSADRLWAAHIIQREMRRYLAVSEAQRFLVALSLRRWRLASRPELVPPRGFTDSQLFAECCREYEYRLQVEHYSTMILAAEELDQINRDCPQPIRDAALELATEEVGGVRLLLTGSSWFRKCLLTNDEIASVWSEVGALLQQGELSPKEVEEMNVFLAPAYALSFASLPSVPSVPSPSPSSATEYAATAPIPISAPMSLVEASKRDDIYESQWRGADPLERRARRRGCVDASDEEGDIRDIMEDWGIELDPPPLPTSCTMATETMQVDDDEPLPDDDTSRGAAASMVLGRHASRFVSAPTDCIVCELDRVDVVPCSGCGAWVHPECAVSVDGGGGELWCSRLCR